MNIKKANVNDVEALQQIGKQTFMETFSTDNTQENMTNYLNEAFSIEKIREELRNKYSEFYLAFSSNILLGYLKINFENAQTEKTLGNSLEIERIYVLKNFKEMRLVKNYSKKHLKLQKVNHLNMYGWGFGNKT